MLNKISQHIFLSKSCVNLNTATFVRFFKITKLEGVKYRCSKMPQFTHDTRIFLNLSSLIGVKHRRIYWGVQPPPPPPPTFVRFFKIPKLEGVKYRCSKMPQFTHDTRIFLNLSSLIGVKHRRVYWGVQPPPRCQLQSPEKIPTPPPQKNSNPPHIERVFS